MRRRIRTRVGASAAILLVAAALGGCSQVAALAPVGGNRLAEVRFAALDVLTASGTDLLTAPVCTSTDAGAVLCHGETASGDPVTVTSPATSQDDLRITVGATTLYSGSVAGALDAAVRPTP